MAFSHSASFALHPRFMAIHLSSSNFLLTDSDHPSRPAHMRALCAFPSLYTRGWGRTRIPKTSLQDALSALWGRLCAVASPVKAVFRV